MNVFQIIRVVLAVAQHVFETNPTASDEAVAQAVDDALQLSGIAEKLDGPIALFVISLARRLVTGGLL